MNELAELVEIVKKDNAGRVRVKFIGQAEASTKWYRYSRSLNPIVGDRAVALRISGTYVVIAVLV